MNTVIRRAALGVAAAATLTLAACSSGTTSTAAVSVADPGMDRCPGCDRSGFGAEAEFASSFGEVGRIVAGGGSVAYGECAVDPGIG